MERRYICDGEKYRIGKGYITLPVNINIPFETIDIEGVTLQKKESFHISLICVKNLIKKYGEEIEEKIISLFCDFVKENPIEYIPPEKEFRFVEREDGRKTLIKMVSVSNLDSFFELLNKEGIEVEKQPTHMTLYTLNLNEGIGINNQSDLERMTKVVGVPKELKIIFED